MRYNEDLDIVVRDEKISDVSMKFKECRDFKVRDMLSTNLFGELRFSWRLPWKLAIRSSS